MSDRRRSDIAAPLLAGTLAFACCALAGAWVMRRAAEVWQ